MRTSAGVVLLVGIVLASATGCGGAGRASIRIGILSDCYGPFSSAHELIVASAELPLIERGGVLKGANPSDGIEGASVAGHPVELGVGCVSGTEDVLRESRRLVEGEGAQILVGPMYPEHGLIVRDYARMRPETTFLIQPSGAPELTSSSPPPNVFRFTVDNAQSSAGLGAYAYNDLGWRRAAIVGDNSPYGWGTAAGFIAEFCSLGGDIVTRQWFQFLTDPADAVPRIPSSADGVYLGVVLSPVHAFLRAYAGGHGLSKHVVGNAAMLSDPTVAADAQDVVLGGPQPLQPTAAAAAYVEAFTKAFPSIPAAVALSPLAVPFHDGVEAALEGLERTGGEPGSKLMAALARLRLSSLNGPVRLNARHQAISSTYLSRVGFDAKGKPAIKTVRVVPNVEQTFGGYFTANDPPPTRTTPACKKRKPPPWARR
jgi:branched-chain amino acid transport system substrate-binding protein